MDFSSTNNLTVRFDDDEINSFLTILKKLKKQATKAGFKKEFQPYERLLIEDLCNRLIIEDEENTN